MEEELVKLAMLQGMGGTRRILVVVLTVLSVVGATAARTAAQAPGTGAIAGLTTDPSGAAVANARISIVDEGSRLTRTPETTAEGTFRATLLPPGNYSVAVEASGFGKQL